MTEKVAMVIKADLQCPSCYKKIKKILCRYPQIRDQVYDEKGNTVIVTVVGYDPEKIRDKLYSRGGKVIKGIEIKASAKPKEPEKKKETEKPKEKPKELEKMKVVVVEKPKDPEKPVVVVVEKINESEKLKSGGGKPEGKPKEAPKSKGPEQAPNPPPPEPMKLPAATPASGFPHPAMAYYGPNYDGYGGGTPYYHGFGVPPPPQPTYDGYVGYGYPYGRDPHVNRGDSYFSEENPWACSIM